MRNGACLLGLGLLLLLLFPTSSYASDVTLTWVTTTGSGTVGGSDITAAPGDTLTLSVGVVPDGSGVRQISASLSFDASVLSLVSATEVGSATMTGPLTAGLTTTTTAPPTGDCDGDGAVGLSDYVQFIVTFGLIVPPFSGCDFDGNGIIGFPPPGELPAIVTYYQYGSPTAPASNLVLGIEEASGPSDPTQTAPFTLGLVTFQVGTASGTSIDLFFNPKIDGVYDGTDTVIANSAMPTGVNLNGATVNGGPVTSVPFLGPWAAFLLGLGLIGCGSQLARSRTAAHR